MTKLALAYGLLMLSCAASAQYDDDPQMQAVLARCPEAAKFISEHPHKAMQPSVPAALPSMPALRDELLRMEKADQQARSGDWGEEDIKQMLAVDAAHLPRIKQIVDEHGFPTDTMVGEDGASAAWLLVQHADADPAFQAQVLKEISPRLKTGGLKPQDYALLTDRVLLAQGKPQRYGSQLEAKGGKWAVRPLEDAANLDARRAALGMMPHAAYICLVGAMNDPLPALPGDTKKH